MQEKLYTKATISKSSDEDFVAVASTAIKDRHGEVVSVEGWDLKNFKANPVLLWAHDHYEPAIGTASKVWIEGTGKKAALMIRGKFHEYTERARAVKQMVQEGIIKTMSVGFKPIDMDDNTYTKQELLEVSFVNVPANPQAQISAIKSLREAGIQDKTIAELGIPIAVYDRMTELEKNVNSLEEQFKTVVKAQVPVNPQGRYSRILRDRQQQAKIIAKAADKLLKENPPQPKRVRLIKIMKRSSEMIIVSHKEQINGTHKGIT